MKRIIITLFITAAALASAETRLKPHTAYGCRYVRVCAGVGHCQWIYVCD